MAAAIPEVEAYIGFRLSEMASRNEHHRFEEIATRIARKRISSNILIATGPVGSGGDQQRDAESYTTYIPAELPHSAGFSASASTAAVVIACTVQQARLKDKVLADLAGICTPDADPVSHVAFFSVHPISAGTTHDLKNLARETYGVTLDIFSGNDIATILAEPDLVWVARHYLELPSSMVPPPEDESTPEWYVELLENLRSNGGPAALTPATQGEVTEGLRFATWDEAANADLAEWVEFMGAFLADSVDGKDSELAFRACYEMSVAQFRGMGIAARVEDLVRRAIEYACTSNQPNIVDDAVVLASYWGTMWTTGVGSAEAAEIAEALERLRVHIAALRGSTDVSTHPVRAASLTGTLAFLHLLPDLLKAERERGRPVPRDTAPAVGVRLDENDVDISALTRHDLLDADAAMTHLDELVDLLPRARAYSVSQLARVFTMFAPLLSTHPSYTKVRDGLDEAAAEVEGGSAIAERCRDRAIAFVKCGRPLEALLELHSTKVNWFNGENLYGAVMAIRFIAKLYAEMGLTFAAKMYASAAAALALVHGDQDVRTHAPRALLEVAQYARQAGCWADAAGLMEIALLARAHYLTDPFDLDRYPELAAQQTNAALELSAVRKFWPALEPLVTDPDDRTGWFSLLADLVDGAGAEYDMSEAEYQRAASEQLAGPVFSDLGVSRVIDFRALGVRWIFSFDNDRSTVLAAEGFCATFQVFLADIAPQEPVLIGSTVRVNVQVRSDGGHELDSVDIDASAPEILAHIVVSSELDITEAREHSLVAMCFELLLAVHARPAEDLKPVLESLFMAGLPHKLFIGRPYEESAGLLDDEHYSRCAAALRPASSAGFCPTESAALAAPTSVGPGYDHEESLKAVRERYEVAYRTLRHTLPRLLADESRRAAIVRLREGGCLDWQILVVLVNAAWNWRMQQAGISLVEGDPAVKMRLARQPETPASPEIPLGVFGDKELDIHLHVQPMTVATRWHLRGRQEVTGEGAMRDLITRRYRYGLDDVPHRDLLDCLDEGGHLLPFVEP